MSGEPPERYVLFIGLTEPVEAKILAMPGAVVTRMPTVSLRLWCRDCEELIPHWGSSGHIEPSELARSTDEHDAQRHQGKMAMAGSEAAPGIVASR